MNEVEKYIAEFPEEIQIILLEIRKTINSEAKNSVESMAYGMPAYKLNGKPLIYFAANKNHIGLYATPSAHSEFKEELKGYKQGKGSVQFPLDKPIPFELIKQIVEFKKHEILNINK